MAIEGMDKVRDRLKVFALAKENVFTSIIFSASKTLFIYGERLGAQIILGKNKEVDLSDLKRYIDNFMNMINELDYDEELLDEGIAFNEIYKQENRKNCVAKSSCNDTYP